MAEFYEKLGLKIFVISFGVMLALQVRRPEDLSFHAWDNRKNQPWRVK